MTRPAISRKGFDDELVMAEATELCPLEGGLSQLRCLHIGVNRIYVDEIRSTVVRVHHSDDFSRERVDKTLRLANHLRDHDVPVVTPFSRRCVELPKSKCWATYWPCYDEIEHVASRSFGRHLARWHLQALSAGIEDDLPLFMDTAIARVDERCASAERAGVPSEVTGQLHDRIHELAGFEAGRRFVLHGDAHRHNIVSVGGLWLFVDLDDLSVGALEHDLAPVAMACLRYHSPNFELDKVIKGYLDLEAPFSPRLLVGAVRIREVLTSLAGLELWDDPAAQSELRLRIDTMRSEPSRSVRWTPLIRRSVS